VIDRLEPLEGTVERVHGLLEAPCWRPDGSLIYSDVSSGGIFELPAGGPARELLAGRRGVGGLLPHAGGGVVASGRSVFHFLGERQRELLRVEGVAGFNDLSTDGEGRIYAGALRFRPMAGEPPVPGEIWRIERDGSAEPVASGIEWPNGLGHSADGSTLYASDTARGVILAFAAEGDGEARGLRRGPGRRTGWARRGRGGSRLGGAGC
jgi:sugar lactone lactonase YvrE